MELVHKSELSRYELSAGGATAVLEYESEGEVLVFTHTFVPEALRGQNIAGRLTRFALDDVRQAGKKVRPQCSYTQLFLRRHPEYAPLQAEGATPAPACALPRNR